MQLLQLRTSASGAVAELALARGQGIVGDRHAQPGSPRQVLLVAEQTLSDFHLQPGDLRENCLAAGDLADFASGQVWQLGATAQLRLMFRCEPCRRLDRLQSGLARRIGQQRGWLALVVASGSVQAGDRLQRCATQFPALSDRPQDRFVEFVARIPPGRVVRTPALLQALGLARAYSRVLPTYLRQAPADLPIHRLLRADGRGWARDWPRQAAQLQAEGVMATGDRVTATDRDWPPAAFHALDSPLA